MTKMKSSEMEMRTVAASWARSGDFTDWTCFDVNATAVAEHTAHELEHDEWLDDETHNIWDIALEESERQEEVLRMRFEGVNDEG